MECYASEAPAVVGRDCTSANTDACTSATTDARTDVLHPMCTGTTERSRSGSHGTKWTPRTAPARSVPELRLRADAGAESGADDGAAVDSALA